MTFYDELCRMSGERTADTRYPVRGVRSCETPGKAGEPVEPRGNSQPVLSFDKLRTNGRDSPDRVTASHVSEILSRSELQPRDLQALLSPEAVPHLEEIAQAAHRLTIRQFGPTMLMFTPLYLANYCDNYCLYCGFSAANDIPRRQLTLDEVEAEARAIAATGLQHILILTGESRRHSSVFYIADCVRVLRKHFSSVSIEVYPLSTDEYGELVRAGVDGLTLYQEVYDQAIYDRLHPRGPKRNYRFRLEAPERAGEAGVRTVNIGPLLGLNDWRKEVLIAGLHAAYLQRRFPDVEVSVSLPRMRPEVGGYQAEFTVSDRDLVQAMIALRLFLPCAGITLSTRESSELRDHLLKLGVTKMSGGSSTVIGGHTSPENGTGQFEIADRRSVEEVRRAIVAQGYKPILKDWHDLIPGGKEYDAAASISPR